MSADSNGRWTVPPAEGVWLSYNESWTVIIAWDNPVEASDYAAEHPEMLWAWAPWGEWFGPGCIVVEGLIGGP